jgi:uncharacterized repeat protein (TIGR02543 family)
LTGNAFTKAGYTFAGWNTVAGGGGTAYANSASYPFTASTTLYAQWTINQYTVTFDANTGTGTMAAQTANYNAATALTGNAFTKAGYTFAGWNTVAGGGGTAYANSASYPFTASTTLYAQWTAIPTIGVTYNGNTSTGGAVPTDAGSYVNGATVTVLGNTGALVKAGYTFAGWNTLANGTGTAQAAASTFAMGSAAVTLYAQWTLTPVEPATRPIPSVIPPPIVLGVGSNQLAPLNLNSGDGPAMTNCLLDQLRNLVGANAVYQGQTVDGGGRIGQTGLLVSFYALEATANTTYGFGGPGVYLRTSNPLNVVTSCGTFTTTPAVYNLSEWGAFLYAMGLSAHFDTQGVMTVVVGGTTYVARPDYSVTQVDPGTLTGTPRLVTGSDGLMRFTDSAGNVQILYPAFIDPETLGSQVAQAVGGATTLIQSDGTALVTLWNGQKFVLTPDMTLGTVPPEQLGAGWWQDGPDHYRYRNSSFSPTSQGFTVRAVP